MILRTITGKLAYAENNRVMAAHWLIPRVLLLCTGVLSVSSMIAYKLTNVFIIILLALHFSFWDYFIIFSRRKKVGWFLQVFPCFSVPSFFSATG